MEDLKDENIVAAILTTALLRATDHDLNQGEAPDIAAKMYFECLDALKTEAKKRPPEPTPPTKTSFVRGMS